MAIAGLKIKDKLYDGKNTAQFEGTPVLSGLIDGDNPRLILGVPTFDSAEIGRDISVSFTPFALGGDSTTVGNYILIQPSGVTASIREYVADGSEYFVNSNDWIHTDFTVTAKAGFALSLTGAVDGEWTDVLYVSDETDSGRLTFYVKNTVTGAISASVTEQYKIDRTPPTQTGLTDRKVYCEAVPFTVADGNGILSVTVNGTPLTAVNGQYTVLPTAGIAHVVVTDVAGNQLQITITVNADHTWGRWTSNGNGTHTRVCAADSAHTETEACHGGTATCTNSAACQDCGAAYGSQNPNQHSGVPEWILTETAHEKRWGCCCVVIIVSENHEWANGTCVDCGYSCKHTGGTATCTELAVCEICGEHYGALNPDHHTGTAEWDCSPLTHEKRWSCCHSEADAKEEHEWKNGVCEKCQWECTHSGGVATCHTLAVCEVCGMEYGEFDPHRHEGKTEIRNARKETCTEDGYSGDLYCEGCQEKLESGEVVKATGHKGGTATCNTKARCSVCGEFYGSFRADNHEGGTELRYEKEATCTEDGYTGDIYCKGCGSELEAGEKITAPGHKGGTATCAAKAVCDVCHSEYGEQDPEHHAELTRVEAVPATVVAVGNVEYYYCAACSGYFRDAGASEKIQSSDVILKKLEPAIIEGMDGIWEKGNKDTLCFRSNAAYPDFVEVLIDGKVIDKEAYNVREGSIVVELKASFMETLTAEKHTLTVRSESGDAVTEFTVAAKTASRGILWLYVILAVVILGAGATVVVIIARKKKGTEESK